MKTRVFSICILVVGVALVLTWAVAAQESGPRTSYAPDVPVLLRSQTTKAVTTK
jgi:hypothetical protein